MKRLFSILLLIGATLLAGCHRVETGEVGLRRGFDKQVSQGELMPGSFNQTFIGDVISFPVRQIKFESDDQKPITADNSTMADFKFVVIYSINPVAVYELYTTKSPGFHALDHAGDTVLMYNYIQTTANSAAFKAMRKYEALKVNDNRDNIQNDIRTFMTQTLADEKLEGALTINQIQVVNMQIDAGIAASANNVVRARNDLATKTIEVQTAAQEALRIAAINSPTNISYMNAQANLEIAKGVANGKVHTIVVPYDFKGIVSTKN